MKNNKGITLIALIITVIVLTILTGLTIDIAIDGKLIDNARETVGKANSDLEQAQQQTNNSLSGWLNESGVGIRGGTQESIDNGCLFHIFGEWEITKEATCTEKGERQRECTKCGYIQIEEITVNHTFLNGTCTKCGITCASHTYGEWRIITEATCTATGSKERTCTNCGQGETEEIAALGHTYSKGTCTECGITGVNEPDITGFNNNNTYYVSWNLSNSPYIIDDTTLISGTAASNWYDYTAGVNKWANIKTTGGGNDCYWVWIPRYAYKVPTRSSTAETIEIKFLDKATNIPIGETEAITNTTPTPGTWVVHPAFTDAGNGGFGELTGIWVAKYEASSNSSSVVENPTEAELAIDGGSDTDTDLKERVKPNVTSWRRITVENIFTVCQNLILAENSLAGTTNIDSHMMKNTEWGAVAYLSRSVYGKNGEVYNNPYYNNTTNYSTVTGLCGNETNGKDNATTNMSNTVKYNETGGGNASTTGNVYGIYDMAGGTWEYVAGIYTAGGSTNYRSKLWDSNNSKYVDKYTKTTGSAETYYGNTDKYGDAVYETSSSGYSTSGSWDSGYSYFPKSAYPVFGRGDRADGGENAGIFAFGFREGDELPFCGFRPVCFVTYQ